MSGPEWTNDDRDDSRPMSRDEAGSEPQPDHDQDPVPSFTRVRAQSPEPAMNRDHQTPDRDEPAPEGRPSQATPRERPDFVGMALALLSKIPKFWLGTERHEMMPDAPQPDSATPGDARPIADASPIRVARFPILAMKRETRVGLAAVLSFVLLVTAWVVQKKKGDKAPVEREPIALSLNKPDGTPTPDASGEKDKSKLDNGGSKKEGEGEPKKPKPPASNPPEPNRAGPGEATGPKTLGADPDAGGPTHLPPPVTTGASAAVLGSTPETVTPPTLPAPNASTPKPPESPSTTPDPLTIPDGPPAITPPDMSAPGSNPNPIPSVEPPPVVPKEADTRKEVEINPATAPLLPPVGDPPPTVEVSPNHPAPVAQPPSTLMPPIQEPNPVATSGPIPTDKPPTLESVPAATPAVAGAVEPSATRASTAAALGAGWMVIPSGGRRILGSIPIISTPSDVEASPTPSRVADGPKFTDDAGAADQVEPVVHTVAAGENFWTISILFYHSGRFYKALHAANRRQVPDIRKLYVGTVLRIPPPEALDRALIDPGRPEADGPSPSTVNRTSKRQEPIDDADLALPVRPRLTRPDPEAVAPVRRPTYKARRHETLRSIARDTLNDPKRDREIYNLNRDVLDDINVLPEGTTLTLPEDAIIGRRAAR